MILGGYIYTIYHNVAMPLVAIGSKYVYDISSYNVTVKPAVWNVFAMSLESVFICYFYSSHATGTFLM